MWPAFYAAFGEGSPVRPPLSDVATIVFSVVAEAVPVEAVRAAAKAADDFLAGGRTRITTGRRNIIPRNRGLAAHNNRERQVIQWPVAEVKLAVRRRTVAVLSVFLGGARRSEAGRTPEVSRVAFGAAPSP